MIRRSALGTLLYWDGPEDTEAAAEYPHNAGTTSCRSPFWGAELHDPRGCRCERPIHRCDVCGVACKGVACSEEHALSLTRRAA